MHTADVIHGGVPVGLSPKYDTVFVAGYHRKFPALDHGNVAGNGCVSVTATIGFLNALNPRLKSPTSKIGLARGYPRPLR